MAVVEVHRSEIAYSAYTNNASFAGMGIISGIVLTDPVNPLRVVAVTAKKPGRIKFTNPSEENPHVSHGKRFAKDDPDGEVTMAPGTSARFRVIRKTIAYRAYTDNGVRAGHGLIEQIKVLK